MRTRNPYFQKLEHVRDNSFPARLKRVAFATVAFVAGYIAAVYTDRMAVYLSSIAFGYDPDVYFWTVSGFPMKHIEWSKARVMLIFSIGSVSLFTVAVTTMLLYKKISKDLLLLKLFAVWLSYNCLGLLGANIATSIFGLEDYSSVYFSGFSVICVWWGIPTAVLFIALFLYAVALFIIGYFSVSRLLRFSHSQRLVGKYHGRLQTLLIYYILPGMAGALLLSPFSINNILFLAFHIAGLLMLLIGMIARINVYYEIHGVYRADIGESKPWIALPLALFYLLPVLNS